MKKKCYKIKIISIIILATILIFVNKKYANAASANISASSNNVQVGDNVTVNVTVDAVTWNIKVNGSGISDTIVGGNLDELANKTTNKSYKLDTSKPGVYTINLSGDVTEASNGSNTNQSGAVTITVAEKSSNTSTTQTTTTTQTTKTQSEPEAKFTDTNKTMYSTGDINVRSSYSTSSKAVGSLKEGDTVTVIGTSSNGWSKVKFNGQTAYVKTSLLTDKKPEKKSNNNFLKSLKIDGVSLNPEFSKDVTDYKITVGKDVESLKIDARSRR